MDSTLIANLFDTAFGEYCADPTPDTAFELDLEELAKRLEILPLARDGGGCFALCRDGRVVSLTWDEPEKLRVEDDPFLVRMALFQGSRQYSALKPLVPKKPANAVTCTDCQGTGVTNLVPETLRNSVVCSCGGLGWTSAK